MAGSSTVRAGKAFVELSRDDSKMMAGLHNTSAKFKAWGATLTKMGTKFLGAGLTAALPLGLSMKTFAAFDDGMRAVKAVSQSTEAEFRSLTEKAKALGASTSFTAIEVANLMAELGRAGFVAGQIKSMTGAVLDLARATGTDATLSSGIMAATIRQFGLEAEDATRVADGLTAAANKSFNTVESLGEALKYVGPDAAAANMSLEETLALLGALGNVGKQGSEAGTAMRRLITMSGAEAKMWTETFGIQALDAAGNVRPLIDILDDITKAVDGMPSGERLEKFNKAFGLLGITAATALGKSAGSARDLRKAIESASGIAADTAKQMDAGIGGSFRILQSAVEGVAIAFGAALAPAIKVIADNLAWVSSTITRFVDQYQGAAKLIAGSVAAVIGLGVAFIAVGLSLELASISLSAFGAVATAIVSPIGVLAMVIGSLGTFILTSTQEGAAALAWLGEQFAGVADDAKLAMSGVLRALNAGDFELAGQILWATLNVVFTRGSTTVKKTWNDLWTGMLATGEIMWNSIRTATIDIIGFMLRSWAKLSTGLQSVWNDLTHEAEGVWIALKKAAGSIDQTQAMDEMDASTRKFREKRDKLAADAARSVAEIEADAHASREAERKRHEERMAKLAGDNQGANEAAQRELDELIQKRNALTDEPQSELRMKRAVMGIGGWSAEAAPVPDLAAIGKGLATVGAASGVLGTFSGDAASRMFGGGDPAERAAKAAESALEIHRRALRLLQRIDRDGGAGFAR